jgi:3D (Asp-Asp-Asp) domain-containing protein
MEGSAAIQDPDGSTTTYNYAGTTDADIVDCSQYFRHDVSRTKFRKANGIYGDGVKSFKLVPYRSVAVDSDEHIPFGSILYIPDARGVKVQLPDGSMAQHDGYFFAADTGGAIKGDHIDVFLGSTNGNPFPWVKSKQSGKFSAYLVDDLRVRNYLETLHN